MVLKGECLETFPTQDTAKTTEHWKMSTVEAKPGDNDTDFVIRGRSTSHWIRCTGPGEREAWMTAIWATRAAIP